MAIEQAGWHLQLPIRIFMPMGLQLRVLTFYFFKKNGTKDIKCLTWYTFNKSEIKVAFTEIILKNALEKWYFGKNLNKNRAFFEA